MPDNLTSNQKLRRFTNKCVMTPDGPADYLRESPDGEWIGYDDYERLQRRIAELEQSVESSFYLDGLSIHQWREHAKKGWEKARAAAPPPTGCQAPNLGCTCWFMGKDDIRPDHSPDCALKQRPAQPPSDAQWISVNDRLPVDGQPVVYYFDVVGVHVGRYLGCNNDDSLPCFGGDRGWLTGDVTHWMPLPALPGAAPTKEPPETCQYCGKALPAGCNSEFSGEPACHYSRTAPEATVPKGHFWRGAVNRFCCRNCGNHYSDHLHTDEASTCPVETGGTR